MKISSGNSKASSGNFHRPIGSGKWLTIFNGPDRIAPRIYGGCLVIRIEL